MGCAPVNPKSKNIHFYLYRQICSVFIRDGYISKNINKG